MFQLQQEYWNLLQLMILLSHYVYILWTGTNWTTSLWWFKIPWCQAINCDDCYATHIDGVVQERCNSSALAMELRLSCTNPLISCCCHYNKSTFHVQEQHWMPFCESKWPNDLEGQGQCLPFSIPAANIPRCIFGAKLVILVQIH